MLATANFCLNREEATPELNIQLRSRRLYGHAARVCSTPAAALRTCGFAGSGSMAAAAGAGSSTVSASSARVISSALRFHLTEARADYARYRLKTP